MDNNVLDLDGVMLSTGLLPQRGFSSLEMMRLVA